MTSPSLAPAPVAAPPSVQASPWPTFWIACIAVFLVSIDSTVLFAAFGTLQQAFPAATAADLSWVLNAYTVVYATMLIPAGGLADAHGRKRVFLGGVALFLAASAACGMADSVAMLIAARVVQALGAALLTPASLSIILDAFPKEKRTVAVSLWGAVGGLAAALAPALAAASSTPSAGLGRSTSTFRSARCRCGLARPGCAKRQPALPGRGSMWWACYS